MNRDPTRVLSAGSRSAPWGSWPGVRAGHEPQVRRRLRRESLSKWVEGQQRSENRRTILVS